MTDDGVIELALACRRLVELDLAGLEQLTDETLFELSEGCPRLVSLALDGLQMVTNEGVGALTSCTCAACGFCG